MTDINALAKQVEALTALVGQLVQVGQPVTAKSTGRVASDSRFARKDRMIVSGFKRKGIKDVVLMDRSDRSKAFNVKPFKAWLAEGRVVRKGEHGVRGLFHISQTDKVSVAAEAKSKPAKPASDEAPKTIKSLQDLGEVVHWKR